jgi:hypothetical protein
MDALSSQANVGGYKAVLIAANAFGRYFPLLTTAAGTARPANVLILGIGVAGLQAIGTARRLGAVVRAYDVRSETKEQAESLGAQFLVLKSVADAAGEGGYARQLTKDEQAAQQQELNSHIAGMDIVITTAQVPGRRPPLLVTKAAVQGMKPGSVIVDMAASSLGGNVELSKPGQTIVTKNGVTIIAPENLPATMPVGASAFYARNISSLLLGMVKDGKLHLDFSDEVTAGTVICHAGKVVQPATLKLLEAAAVAPGAAKAAPAPRPAKAPTRPAAKVRPAAKLPPVAATAVSAAAPAQVPSAAVAAKPPRPTKSRPVTPESVAAPAAASTPTQPRSVTPEPVAAPAAASAPVAAPAAASAPVASSPAASAPAAPVPAMPAARPAPPPTVPAAPTARARLTPSPRPALPPAARPAAPTSPTLAPVVPSVISVGPSSSSSTPSGGALKPRPWVKARERAAARPAPTEPTSAPTPPASEPETGGEG